MFHDDAGACMSPGFFIPYKGLILDIRVIIQIGSLSTSEVNASCLMEEAGFVLYGWRVVKTAG